MEAEGPRGRLRAVLFSVGPREDGPELVEKQEELTEK